MKDPNEELIHSIENRIICDKDPRYTVAGYLFVIRALDSLMGKIVSETNQRRHVTGQELSFAVRDLALREFGPTAKMVLEHWGIGHTDDIGHIVYNLIEIGLMGKTEEDRLEDFHKVYEFEDEFVRKFRFSAGSLKN